MITKKKLYYFGIFIAICLMAGVIMTSVFFHSEKLNRVSGIEDDVSHLQHDLEEMEKTQNKLYDVVESFINRE